MTGAASADAARADGRRRAGPPRGAAFPRLDEALREVLPDADDALAVASRRIAHLDGAPPSLVVPVVYAAAAMSAAAPGWIRPSLDGVVAALAREAGVPEEAARLQLYAVALGEAAALPEAAEAVVRRVLDLVRGLAPAAGASAWVLEPAAVPPLRCVEAVGTHAGGTEQLVATAARGLLADRVVGADCAVAMGHRAGVVLARLEPSALGRGGAFLGMAAETLRLRLAEARFRALTGTQRETLVEAAERRLIRLGLDLHDGPAQSLAALLADTAVVRARLADADGVPAQALAFLDELAERLREVGAEIRDLAQSLESRSVVRRPLAAALRQELDALERRSGIRTTLEVAGDLSGLTASQQIALVRVAQEALANVREHSGATRVDLAARRADGSTRLEIADDGRGFDVVRGRERAARRGRLGLAGMRERLALLGGGLDVVSRPGGPTIVRATVPDWAPDGGGASA